MVHDSDDFADAADDLIEAERFEDALGVIRQGLRQFPGDNTLRYLEASMLGELGHYPLAREILEQLRRQYPEDVDAVFLTELLGAYLNLGRRNDALQCFEDALRQEDFDEDSAHWVAGLLYDHGFYRESARSAARAIRFRPKDDGGWLRLAFALYGEKRWTAAEFCCRRALERRPGRPIALDLLGIIYFDSGRREEARHCWELIPIEDHFDPVSLVAWRSTLGHGDPRISMIRKRWSELRAESRQENPFGL